MKKLFICMIAGRNAIGDSYKNIVNSLEHKEDITCLIPSGYSKNEFSEEINFIIQEDVTNSQSKYLKAFSLLKKIKNIVIKKNIKKIFIYFDNHWFNFLVYLTLRNLNVEYTMWIHDPILHLGECKQIKLIRKLNHHYLFAKIDKFIVSYNSAVDDLANTYKLDKNKINTIYLPRILEMEFADVKKSVVPIKYDFIFFGRIEEYKGVELLVEVVKKKHDIKLLIVGRGQNDNEIKKRIQGHDNITFINTYLENRELAKKIKESRWVVLPYKTATGSLTIQVANFYEKPVIATRVGCFQEYILNGQNGFFIDNYDYDSLDKVMKMTKEINTDKLKNSINLVLQSFDIKKIVKDIDEVLTR